MFFNFHFIILLLRLEIMLLGVFLALCLGYLEGVGVGGIFFYLLVLVCIGGYGISLLVSLYRGAGCDWWGRVFF